MKPEIDPKVDYAFKRLFGVDANRPLLIDALNAVLQWPEGRRVRQVELLNPFNEREYSTDKLSVLDIKASDQAGRQHHVEMQLAVPILFDKRIVYYWAKFHQQQMREGDYYQTLCPTISVWWLNQNLLDDAAYHHKFQLWDHERGILLSKDLEIHTLELSKFTPRVEELTTPLEQWCYFLKHGATLDSAKLPATLDSPPIRQALEVLMVVSQSELERHRYEERVKEQQERATWQFELEHGARLARERGLEEGREQGLQEGLQQGLQRGQLAGRIRLCQQLLAQPLLSDEQVQQASLEELAKLAEQLEQQVTASRRPTQ